jgi:hypothetical protein
MTQINDKITRLGKSQNIFRWNGFIKLNFYRKRIIFLFVSTGSFFIIPILSHAQENDSKIVFQQGFEKKKVDVDLYPCDSPGYTVNYNGLTEECSHSGQKSYKLDVSFKKSLRFMVYFPVKIPAEQLEDFSGYMRIVSSGNGKATLGISFALPPTAHKHCTLPNSNCKLMEQQWKLFEIDNLKIKASQMAEFILERDNYHIHKNDVSKQLDIIMNYPAEAGDRLIVYIDDLKLSGKLPDQDTYQKKLEEQQQRLMNRQCREVDKCLKYLNACETKLEKTGKLNGGLHQIKEEFLGKHKKYKRELSGRQQKKLFFQKSDYCRFRQLLEQLKYLDKNIDKLKELKDSDYISYIVPNSTGPQMFLPRDKIIPASIDKILEITACPGEYEPASLIIQALRNMSGVSLEFTDLSAADPKISDTIKKSCFRTNVVKCWYQAGTAWYAIQQSRTKRVLVPELLLNDDSLVKVDYKEKNNYLKLKFPDKEEYVCVSDNINITGFKTPEEFPVFDARTLQPVDIPVDTNKQFWITLKVPASIVPGSYTGEIAIKEKNAVIGKIALQVNVLPFKLLPPYYTSSIDYHGRINKTGCTTRSYPKTRAQFKADLKNMLEHGITNCQHYFPANEKNLKEVLELRREVGMDNKILYLKGSTCIGNPTSPEDLNHLKKKIRDIIEFVKPYGVKTVYFYGIDERRGNVLKSQRPAWNAVHEAGGKIFVAGYGDNIDLMGNIQDLMIRAGWPDHDEVSRWHAYGHKIFCYHNPQIGVENPDVYRRNFGLLLWKYNYDGAADNAFQQVYGNIWNDFSHRNLRSHSIVYPTVDGGINTIAWEGYREGVDDVRYITTLQTMLEKAEKLNAAKDNPALKRQIAAARKFIKDLKASRKIEIGDLNQLRGKIIEQILALHALMSANK